MMKILALLAVLAMAVHLVKPLGLPGLRRRRDFWKIAAGGLVAFAAVVLLSHGL